MKQSVQSFLPLLILILFTSCSSAQKVKKASEESDLKADFSDRQAIIKATEFFFIGDHTGNISYKKLSMHEKGAYRFVNRNGEYSEFVFDLTSGEADTTYKEELLSIEIYGKLALVQLRLAELTGGHHYKLLTLHKVSGEWKITTITWGTGITQ